MSTHHLVFLWIYERRMEFLLYDMSHIQETTGSATLSLTNTKKTNKIMSLDDFRGLSRRKFNTLRELTRSQSKLARQGSAAWTFVPDRRIIKRIQNDIYSRHLLYAGVELDPLFFNLRETLMHFYRLAPPIRVEYAGAKVRNTPVFYPHVGWKAGLPDIMSFYSDQDSYLSTAAMMDSYKDAEQQHKDLERHHPGGVNFLPSRNSSFEVVFDIMHGLLGSMDVHNAYYKALDILQTPEFAELNVMGVYAALIHFHVRGVYVGETRHLSRWRKEHLDQEYPTDFLVEQHERFRTGNVQPNQMCPYWHETFDHVRGMESELLRLRLHGTHDRTKFTKKLYSIYCWRWGVWENFTAQQQHALMTFERVIPGMETMFSVGKTIGDGIAASEAPEALQSAMRDGIAEAIPEVAQALRAEARQVVDETTRLLDDTVSHVEAVATANVTRMEGIIGRLSGSLDAVMSSFDSVKTYIAGSFSKVKEAILKIPGMAEVDISLESLLMCLRDYILYIHVDSQVLKTLLIISMFRNLGFLDVGYKYFTMLTSYLRGEGTGVETSSPWDFLAGSMEGLIKVIAGVFASICNGACLSAEKFWDLVKALSAKLKEIHFIGAGCLGFSRIFDFISKVYHTVAEWIKVHVFKQEPEKEQLAKKITCWVVKVKYFSTEAGMAAIRANMYFRETAEKLYPEYLELVAHVRSRDDFRNLLMDLERHKREIKDIYDYITRLDAISNFCPTMFHAQFVGAAGIGKSTLMKSFVEDISKTIWKNEKPSFFSFNPNNEFYDNYAGQKIFYIDDCFRYQEPKHLTTLIGLVTNTPVILPMANLNDKGTQLTSEILLSSTNTAWPVGKDVFCMNAVHRRRHMLVETVADSRVIDPSTEAFCMSRYLQHYKAEDLPKMPHLRFNLLRPVPQDESSPNIQHTSEEQFELLQQYAQKLKEANILIATPGSVNLDPTYYFSDNNKPPAPWNLPCKGWNYEELVHNFVVRFRQFRDLERTYTQQSKFAHSEYCLRELEALFHQSDDIDGGVELSTKEGGRPYALIEKWFSHISAPYGSGDPVGAAIAESAGESILPELDDINLDGIVESIVTGSGETSDPIESGDLSRMLAARTARSRLTVPEPLRNRLQVVRHSNDSYIPLTSGFTRWDGYVPFNEPLGGLGVAPNVLGRAQEDRVTDGSKISMLSSFWETQGMKNFIKSMHHNVNYGHVLSEAGWIGKMVHLENEMFKLLFSSKAYFPKVQNFGDKAGKKSTIPLYYLQHLEFVDGTWMFNASKIDFTKDPNVMITQRAHVSKGDSSFTVPIDIAFVMSLMDSFRVFISDFETLSAEEQALLVQDAKWRNQYTGLYTLKSIRENCTSTFKRLTIRSLEFLLSPLNFLFNRAPILITIAASIAAFVGSVWMLRTLAGLIFGNEQETSKFLHRGQQSGIVYHGKLTSQRDEQFYDSLMARNIRRIVLQDVVGRKIEVQGLHDKKFLIIPKHAILGLEEVGDIIASVGIPGTEDFNIYKIPRRNFIASKTSDVCVFTHREIGQTRDASRFFMTEEEFDTSEFSGHFAFMGRFKNNALIEVHPYLRRVLKPTIRTQSGETATLDRALIVKGQTTTGRSGSAVAYATPQSSLKLVGIQVWSLGSAFSPEIAVQVLTQEMIRHLEKEAEMVCEDFVSRLAEPDLPHPERLEGVFTSAEVNQVVGEVPPHELLGKVCKSQFKVTPISSFMDVDGFGSIRCPAALSSRDGRLQHRDHPLKHSVGKYSRGTVQTPTSEIELAKDGLELWIKEALDTDDFRELDYCTIITGTRDDGSSPMNLNSSPGIPFVHSKTQKGKRDFFNISEEGVVDYFDPAVRTEFEHFYNVLKTRRVPLTYAYDFPKDELRPYEKVVGTAETPPKTRSVTCMNMFYLMSWRKNTLRFWNAMHRAADGTFPFCPGINPEGPEWSSAYHYLNRHPNVVDFDVSNWDGYFPPWLFFDLVDIVAKVMNLSEARRNILLSIAFEVTNSYIQYGRTVYQKFRGMLSGFPGTAEKNSMGHWLLAIYFWFRIVRKSNFGAGGGFQRYNTLAAFRANVSLLVYGDDIILSFSDEVREWFNGETLQREYQALGYPVTDGSKNLVVRKWKTLAEATFLKSTWRSCFHHVYIRKMDISVAYDLLYWVRAKNEPLDQFCTNVIDALRIAFGHGREEYNAFVMRLQRWLRQADITLPLYSYREIMADYITRYYGDGFDDTNLYYYS